MRAKKRTVTRAWASLLLACPLFGVGCGDKAPPPPAAPTPAAALPTVSEDGGVFFDLEDRKVSEAFRDIFRFTTLGEKTADGLPTYVVFPHKEHATKRLLEISASCPDFPDLTACTTCHHADLEEDQPRRCAESGCHAGPEDPSGIPSSEKALHDRCIGCHKAVNEDCPDLKLNAAVECKDCHRAPSTQRTVKKIADGDITLSGGN